MIVYRPSDGEVPEAMPKLLPMTCFLMTQLGGSIPDEVAKIRNRIKRQLEKRKIELIDATSATTGKDFLDKIWRMIVGVPLGVAIIHENMPPFTLCNIFYELGMMDALGKRTIIVKTPEASIPSDFVRTEYIESNNQFAKGFGRFLDSILKQEDQFETMAAVLKNNPLLSIDYLRRAHAISGDEKYVNQALENLNGEGFKDRFRSSMENLMLHR